ncbi:MAG: phosphoglycolate phosphatase [Sneathiella sp.]
MLLDFSNMYPMRLLFDLDGTLLDTAPDLHATLNHCLKAAGRPTVTLDSVKHMVGQGAVALLERGLTATGGMPPAEHFEELVKLFFDYYEKHLTDYCYPYDGLMELLPALKDQGCEMAVCTNKPVAFAKTIINGLDLDTFFPVVTGGDSFEVRKPDPGHILKTLDLMHMKSGPAVMIGDTHNDIDAANAAGITSIAVSFGYSDTPAHDLSADYVIDHFSELLPVLESLSYQVPRSD